MGCQKTFNLTVVHWHREHNDFQGSTLADPQCRLHWNDGLMLSLMQSGPTPLLPAAWFANHGKRFLCKANTIWEFIVLDGSLVLTADCSYRLGIYFYSHVGQTKVNQTLFSLFWFILLHVFILCLTSFLPQLILVEVLFFCSLAPQFWVQCIIITMTVFLLQNIK